MVLLRECLYQWIAGSLNTAAHRKIGNRPASILRSVIGGFRILGRLQRQVESMNILCIDYIIKNGCSTAFQ